jgi:hypothetical protein
VVRGCVLSVVFPDVRVDVWLRGGVGAARPFVLFPWWLAGCGRTQRFFFFCKILGALYAGSFLCVLAVRGCILCVVFPGVSWRSVAAFCAGCFLVCPGGPRAFCAWCFLVCPGGLLAHCRVSARSRPPTINQLKPERLGRPQ